jgi:hypothetical protein
MPLYKSQTITLTEVAGFWTTALVMSPRLSQQCAAQALFSWRTTLGAWNWMPAGLKLRCSSSHWAPTCSSSSAGAPVSATELRPCQVTTWKMRGSSTPALGKALAATAAVMAPDAKAAWGWP